jgi:hypothetical protein
MRKAGELGQGRAGQIVEASIIASEAQMRKVGSWGKAGQATGAGRGQAAPVHF